MKDPIERQAAVDVIKKYAFNSPEYACYPFLHQLKVAMKEDLVADINKIPSSEVEPKKQIPQKPITNGLSVQVLCPNCKSQLRTFVTVENSSFTGYERKRLRPNYCEDCGQAIDWSDM